MATASGFYCAGFPCKAFSMLCRDTNLLRDPRAKGFYAAINAIFLTKPYFAVLENVSGFGRVKTQAERCFKKIGLSSEYMIEWVALDPATLGTPVKRARIYILFVRKDLLRKGRRSINELTSALNIKGNLVYEDIMFPQGSAELESQDCLLPM